MYKFLKKLHKKFILHPLRQFLLTILSTHPITLPLKKLSTHRAFQLMLRRLCNRVWLLALMAAGGGGKL